MLTPEALATLEHRTAAAEAAGDREALQAIWLELCGLECVDLEDLAETDTTPAAEAAAIIRDRLAEIRAA